jgi:hypothetical protein
MLAVPIEQADLAEGSPGVLHGAPDDRPEHLVDLPGREHRLVRVA